MRRVAIFLVVVSFAMVPRAWAAADESVAVGPQYDATHVYVAPADLGRFAASVLATFGGTSTKPVTTTVTPTPSRTVSQLLQTPAGTISLFGFSTPIPYPFGAERTGYMVNDLDRAIAAARANGAAVLVAPFPDPIGRDAVIQWPGGVNMQLYVHVTKPSYPALSTIPENRVYLSPDATDAFIRGFVAFSGGKVVADDRRAPGSEIGRPNYSFRRVHIVSNFGELVVFATDGHVPYPYGRELTGYAVRDLAATLTKALAVGVTLLVKPVEVGGRRSAMVEFPGGYVAEIHAPAGSH
jgi:predicted enzyme related to lactoylglutathione lyase